MPPVPPCSWGEALRSPVTLPVSVVSWQSLGGRSSGLSRGGRPGGSDGPGYGPGFQGVLSAARCLKATRVSIGAAHPPRVSPALSAQYTSPLPKTSFCLTPAATPLIRNLVPPRRLMLPPI